LEGTQAPSLYQDSVARVLGVNKGKVNVLCPRTGGGFGAKLTRGAVVAAAAALAATKLSAPVKIFNNRNADMAMTGGREAFSFDYQVGVDDEGVITSLIYSIYVEAGDAMSDATGGLYMGMTWADNAYYIPNYRATAKLCRTSIPAKTSMRAPGVVQTCFATEVVIHRIANELGFDSQVIQQKNFIRNGLTTILGQSIQDCNLQNVWDKLLTRSKYATRLDMVKQFNSTNLWRKKGLSICPVKYGMGWAGYDAGVRLSVNKGDGSIILTHNGCEIGQGINTKAAQTVAYQLGLPLHLITVKYTTTDAVTNGGVTGGSGTSEVVCQATINACSTLLARLAPYLPPNFVKISMCIMNK
jgi:xanthine dehydrogenase/oxidase